MGRLGLRRWLSLGLTIATVSVFALAGAGAVHGRSSLRRARGIVQVTVRGRYLLANGAPWVPRGVQIVGLVAPHRALSGRYRLARAHFGLRELRAAQSAHADVVRFQLSQFGLDPEAQLYSRAYVGAVRAAVGEARRMGFAVIVSLQAEPPAGEPSRCPLPDGGTERVWKEIAPVWRGDHGVLFELYNEPAPPPSAFMWSRWARGGVVSDGQVRCRAVGMQRLIDDIRAAGATNVIIVPGLTYERTLTGRPALRDPTSRRNPQLSYGVHYPPLAMPSGAWDSAFGNAAASAPVIVTEWDADSSSTHCVPGAPTYAPRLLSYLARKRIGIVGFAFDLPGTIIVDWSYAPTTYRAFRCGVPGGGPGQLLFGEFAARSRSAAWGS